MFERGDIVTYKKKVKYYNLTLNNKYTVKSFYYKGDILVIQLVDDNKKFNWFLAEYFEMDLIEQRKKKIKLIKERACLK